MKFKTFITVFLLKLLLVNSYAAINQASQEVHYRTHFGKCPTKILGKLALQLVRIFEQEKSLKPLKQKIIDDNLQEKYYLSSYEVNYNPLTKLLNLSFQCPVPIMKVQVYKSNGVEFYSAILAANGQLLNPNYELLLRTEGILSHSLPALALPVKKIEEDKPGEIANLVNKMSLALSKNLSEVIINEKNDLTFIFSIHGRPLSVFLGEENWSPKLDRLERIVSYTEKNKTIPSIINITDMNKIVVKFPNKF